MNRYFQLAAVVMKAVRVSLREAVIPVELLTIRLTVSASAYSGRMARALASLAYRLLCRSRSPTAQPPSVVVHSISKSVSTTLSL